jgi:adenine-specific DNA-methyltransferase
VLRFAYDDSNALCLDSTCFATGDDVKYLTGVLNSTICIKELLDNSPKTGTGDVITSVQALEPIRVPKASENQRKEIADLVDDCIKILSRKQDADISSYEREIDDLVLNLYGLSEEEKEIFRK